MSYTDLFLASSLCGGSSAAAMDATNLDLNVELGLALQREIDNFAVAEAQLATTADLIDNMLELADGTTDANAAQMMYLMLNNASNGELGAHVPQKGFSMEALSGVRDSLAKGYDIVIEFIEKMIREVKTFLTTFFDKFPGLRKSAAALKEKAGKKTGSPEESKVKLPKAVISSLCGSDKAIGDVIKSLEAVKDLRDNSGVTSIPSYVEKHLTDALTGSADEVKAFSPAGGFADNPYVQCKWPKLGSPKPKALSGLKVKGVDNLPGDRTAAFSYRSSTGAGVDGYLAILASMKIDVYPNNDQLKIEDADHPVLALDRVEGICDAVESVCDTYERAKGEVQDGLKAQEKMVAALKKIKANVDKSDYKDVRSTLNKAKAAYQNLARFATNPAAKLAAYAYTTAQAALSYGDKSLSQYK